MAVQEIIQRILNSFPPFRYISIHLRNRLKIGCNACALPNIHCSGNRVMLCGEHDKLQCAVSAFLRNCVVRVEGDHNSFAMDDHSVLYGDEMQTVYICGNDNQIIIGTNCSLRRVSFFIRGSGNRITIGNHCSAYNVQLHIEQDGNEISIGDGTTLHGREEQSIHMAADEGKRILIGEDCMFSHSIQIRNTDSHSVVDLNGERLNPAKDVVIGKHCWLGFQSVILKGTVLEHNCVVAAGAVCSKKYGESNCVLAGNPAKVVKQNIDWDRKFL